MHKIYMFFLIKNILVGRDYLGSIRVACYEKCNSSLPHVDYLEREIIVLLMMLKCTLEPKTVFLISL
jgi:hypothetical protein